jgi:hypothetical protein
MQLCIDTSLQKGVHTFVFEVYVLINVYTFLQEGMCIYYSNIFAKTVLRRV